MSAESEPSWLSAVTADPKIADAAVLPRRDGEAVTVLVAPQGFSYGPVVRGAVRAAAPGVGDVRVVLVPALPRTDATLDVAAAQELAERSRYSYTFRPAATAAERILIDEVGRLFPEIEISVTDNLADLGGDSLTALLLAERLEERHGVVVDPSDLFGAESLEQLARSAKGAATNG